MDLNEKRSKVTIAMLKRNRTKTDELGEAGINNENSILSSHAN